MKYQKKHTIFSRFRDLFINLDFFGQSPEFYYKGEVTYKSYFGATLTLGIIVIVVFLSLNMITSAINISNVDFRSDLGYTKTPPSIDFDLFGNNIIISVDDPTYSFNHSMFGVRLVWTNQTRFENGTITKSKLNIPLYPCQKRDFPEFEAEFDQYNFKNALCPNATVIPIFGQFLETTFQYLSLKAEPCSNKTHKISSITCASASETTAFFSLGSPKLQVFYRNLRIDASKPTNEMKNYFLDNVFYYLDKTYLSVKNDIFLHDVAVKSLDDFLDSTAYQLTEANYFEPVAQNFLYQTSSSAEYLSCVFRRGQSILKYTRKYYTVGDVAARLGGIWGLIAGSIGLIAKMYNQIGYQKNLGDTIFQYEDLDKANPHKKKSKKKLHKLESTKLQRSLNTNEKYKEFLTKAFMDTYKAFKSPFHYLFARLFCCCRRSTKARIHQQERGLFLARHKLDVLFLLRKLQELEKMKYSLFDKNQRLLFEYIPPSNLSYQLEKNKTKPSSLIEEERKVTKSDVMDALKYYDPQNELESHFRFKNTDAILELYHVSKRMVKNTVNQRLISLLGFRILSLFRYLDHVIKPEENKEIQRTRGVTKAFLMFKSIVDEIRKRKQTMNTERHLSITNGDDSGDEDQDVPVEEKKSIIKTNSPSFRPDLVFHLKHSSLSHAPNFNSGDIHEIGSEENMLKFNSTNDKQSNESLLDEKLHSPTSE